MRCIWLSLTIWALAAAAPSVALAATELRTGPPPDVPMTLPAGVSAVGSNSYAYRPATAAAVRPGLLVLFHGAGGNARRFLEAFRDEADRRNLVLLSIQSDDYTWDFVLRGSRSPNSVGRAGGGRGADRDAPRVDGALKALFQKVAPDPGRIVAAGFSDGASNALAMGLANSRLFTGIVALSPGALGQPSVRHGQKVAIVHGKYDRVLPFANARGMAQALEKAGADVRFIPIDEGHVIERTSLATALDFVFPATN